MKLTKLKHILPILLIILFILIFNFTLGKKILSGTGSVTNKLPIIVKPTLTPTITPTPTAKILTFEEMNILYGPCIYLPTLMYHHIENADIAKSAGHSGLNVPPEIFKQQMEYLVQKGYQTITAGELVAFFDNGKPISPKSILLTFDDGYADFGDNAYPILRQLNLSAILFLPTGLADNPGYLSWNKINEIAGYGKILIANHTRSHKSVLNPDTEVEQEIILADNQLQEHQLNNPKVFSYPYGNENQHTVNFLNSKGYTLAFTTKPGSIMCKQLRLNLPRIRIGNQALNSFGF